MKSVRLFALAAAALCGSACTPSECKEVMPLVTEIEAALVSSTPFAVETQFARLAEVAPEKGDLGILGTISGDLADILRRGKEPVRTAEERSQRDHDLEVLRAQLPNWKNAAVLARRVCD